MTPPPTGRLTPLFRLLPTFFALAACSGGSSHGAPSGKDAAAPNTDAGDTGQDAAEEEAATFSCDAGCPATTADATCVATVQATLVDSTGAPAVGQDLLVCGDNLCSLPGPTDGQGLAQFFLCEQMVLPALKFLGGPGYVSFASGITQANTVFAPITLVPLPSTGAAIPTGGGTVTSGPITLQLAANAVTFDPSQPTDANTQAFRAVQVDVAKLPAALPASLVLTAVWGLAPVNAMLSPPGTLTIPNPNSAAWAPGAKVDFYMNGVEPEAGVAVPYGQWGPVGTGTVSQDGKTISTDTAPGNGLPVLSMVGVRLHT